MAYAKVKKITIDSDQVDGTANISNYQMIFSGTYVGSGDDPDLRTTGNGGDIENTDATGGASGSVTVPADLAFFSDLALTTPLDFEVKSYNASTGQIILIVEIPTLSYTTDTDIYLAYSDSGVTTSQEDVNGTWSSEFKGVYLGGEGSGDLIDSTANGNDLSDNNTVGSGAGLVGNGRDYERDNSEFHRTTSPSNIPTTGDLTLALNIKAESLAALAPTLTVGGTGEAEVENQVWNLLIETNGGLSLRWEYGAGTNQDVFSTTTGLISAATQYRIGIERDTSAKTVKFYVNGSLIDTVGYSNNATGGGSSDFLLGADGNTTVFLDGIVDMAYVIGGIKNTGGVDWFGTDYNNQSSPSTFYSISSTAEPVSVTKGLDYAILTQSSVTKDLDYLIKAPVSITKDLDYLIVRTITAITKGLQYVIAPPTLIALALNYYILTTNGITKDLAYYVLLNQVITKDLAYAILSEGLITKSLDYAIIVSTGITKDLSYSIIAQGLIQLTMQYAIIIDGYIYNYTDRGTTYDGDYQYTERGNVYTDQYN